MLISIKVAKLVIAAIPDVVETWTKGLGFKPMGDIEKQRLNKINLMVFPGTVLLEKPLFKEENIEGIFILYIQHAIFIECSPYLEYLIYLSAETRRCDPSTLVTDDSTNLGVCFKGMGMAESLQQDVGNSSADEIGAESETENVCCENYTQYRAESLQQNIGNTCDKMRAKSEIEHICSKHHPDYRAESSQQDVKSTSIDEMSAKSETEHICGMKYPDFRDGYETSINDCTLAVDTSLGAEETTETSNPIGEKIMGFVEQSGAPAKSVQVNNTKDLRISCKMETTEESLEQRNRKCCANKDGNEPGVKFTENRKIKASEGQENALQRPFLQMSCKGVLGSNFDEDSNIESLGMYDETQLSFEQHSQDVS